MSRGVGIFWDVFLGQPVRIVLTLAFFILHHAALQIESLLAEVEESHAVRFHPQGVVESGGGNIFKKVGAVEGSRTVQIGRAHGLESLDVHAFGVFAAAKHQVLEKMREARLSGLLVLGADVVPEVDRNDGRLVILMHDDGESVIESELLVRDIDVLGLRRSAGGEREKQNQTNEAHNAAPSGKVLYPVFASSQPVSGTLAGVLEKRGTEYTSRDARGVYRPDALSQ